SSPQSNIFTRNWSEGIAFSKWIGIYCSNDGRVATLNLSNMGLKGTIRPSPQKLATSTSLLTKHSFHGHLPDELCRLHQLQSLNLQINEYGGKMPSGLSKMSKNIKRIGNLTELEIGTVV
ncbi:hypothetical protein RJ640_013151, partial [Escallonia rubra]